MSKLKKDPKESSVTPQRFREEKESIEMPVWVYKQSVRSSFSSEMKKTYSMLRLKNQYDPFKSPPSYDKARLHRKATQVGSPSKRRRVRRCECCMYPVDKQLFDMRCSHCQLGFLGTSLAFYFQAMKITIVLLGVLFLAAFVVAVIFNSQFNYYGIEAQILVHLNLGNSDFTFSIILLWFLLTCGLLLVRKYAMREIYSLESNNLSEESYAVQLSNLPLSEEYQIKKWVVNTSGFEPLYIEIAYDIREWVEAFEKREELTINRNRKNLVTLEDTHDFDENNSLSAALLENIKQDSKEFDSQIRKMDDIMMKYRSHSFIAHQKSSGSAFVVFESPKTARDFVNKKRQSKKEGRSNFKQKIVTVEKAPNPRDIVWQNLCRQDNKNNGALNILTVLLGLAFLLLLCRYLKYASSIYDIFKYDYLPYFAVFIVYVLYHLGTNFLVKLSIKLTRCQTYTDQKLVAFRTFALLNIVLGLALPYSLNELGSDLILVINFTLVLDAFMHPFIKAFNLTSIVNKLLGEYIKELEPSKNVYTQHYLNTLLEGQKFRLGENYHYILRALILSSYYAYAAPLGFFYYFVSMFIQVLLQKHLLFKVCKTPPKFSVKLINTFIRSLGIVPFFLILGTLVFKLRNEEKSLEDLWPLATLQLISMCFLYFYAVYLEQFSNEYEETESYFTVREKLREYYKWENPIKRINGELFANVGNYRQLSSTNPQFQISDKLFESQLKERAIIEKARYKLTSRMSLADELCDIHLTQDRRRAEYT